MSGSIAILAGGQSRRMGQDKALVDFLGEPLLQRVIRRISPVTDDLFVVAPPRPGYEAFGVRLVPDRLPGCGPLGGIYTALLSARYHRCLVLSCDLPFVNPLLVRVLLEWPGDYDVLIPTLPEQTGQGGPVTYETLHAVYTKRCVAAIERRLREGIYKIVSFFDDVQVLPIPEETLRQYDPELLSFVNTNTPESLEWARERARAEGEG